MYSERSEPSAPVLHPTSTSFGWIAEFSACASGESKTTSTDILGFVDELCIVKAKGWGFDRRVVKCLLIERWDFLAGGRVAKVERVSLCLRLGSVDALGEE